MRLGLEEASNAALDLSQGSREAETRVPQLVSAVGSTVGLRTSVSHGTLSVKKYMQLVPIIPLVISVVRIDAR